MKNFLLVLLVTFMFVGCRSYNKETYEYVQPNETAFLIPLEGMSKDGQVKFESVAFFETNKVAAKRIIIPRRWTKQGRLPWEGEWIPMVTILKVNRSPETREWTAEPDTGTQNTQEAIPVETQESIGLEIAVSITVSILEENAAKFLYMYSNKNLAEILDTNVRSLVAAKLSDKFGQLSLDEARMKKADVFSEVREELRTELKENGITLVSFGNVGGLQYENPAIQEAIDEQFKTQQKIIIARNNFAAQEIINAQEISIAETEKLKAEEFAKAQEAASTIRLLEIQNNFSKSWDGNLPQVLITLSMGNSAESIFQNIFGTQE